MDVHDEVEQGSMENCYIQALKFLRIIRNLLKKSNTNNMVNIFDFKLPFSIDIKIK